MALFNRIRKVLIKERKLQNYFLYAIGEIVIVVLGIFIAIQLNNLNDNRKNHNKTKLIFEEIVSELQVNIGTCDYLIGWYAQRDSLIQLVKNKKVTYEMYKSNSDLMTLINYYHGLQLKNKAFNKLNKDVNDLPQEYGSIFKKINILYLFLFPIAEKKYDVLASFNNRMHERWAISYDWFSEPGDIVNVEERIDFYLNNQDYINDVRLYSMYSRDNYVYMLKQIREKANEIVRELDTIEKM